MAVFPPTVLSARLARCRLYGGRGPWGGGPGGGGRRRVHRAPGPAAGRDGGADSGRVPLLLGLQGLAADVVVLLPVFVLAKGATIPGGVAAAAGLAGLPAAVPATLRGEAEEGDTSD